MIKAIVFDFDGVIIDSEKIWLNTRVNTLKKHDIKIKRNKNLNFYLGVGSSIFFKKFVPKKIYVNNIENIMKTYRKLLKIAFPEYQNLTRVY